ncbi:uncharacterized protein LOC131636267 [Vicia villosa]|uniref:uncharacterized protein LOC131636267 n=1 Tax=Vicia villosa TaxID=3911 RepID=UPI00273BEBBE|nr:uncharacterized protein LOC131636267 [Vicia villosa]
MTRGRGRLRKKVSSSPFPPSTSVTQADVVTASTGSQNKGEEAAEKQKLWVDVISGNRLPTNGLTIEFSAPKYVEGEFEVEIEEADMESELLFGDSALIMYAIGKNLSMNAVKNYMAKFWNFVQLPGIYYHEEGYFLLKFHSLHDRDQVQMKGPYSIHGAPMVLKEWYPKFEFKRDMLRTLPIWVKLPNLPLHYWGGGAKSLGKIGSVLGTPLCTDECTANKLRVSYARILVEIDVTSKQKDSIIIRDSIGRKIEHPIEYEWKPKYCEKCMKVGHNCDKEKLKVVKQWQQKKDPKQDTGKAVLKKKKEVTLVNKDHLEVEAKQGDVPESSTQWKEVSSKGRKGKLTQDSLPINDGDICFTNGFDSLQFWNESGVNLDPPI